MERTTDISENSNININININSDEEKLIAILAKQICDEIDKEFINSLIDNLFEYQYSDKRYII